MTRSPDTLVWFRSDLRKADNPALNAALEASKRVVGVFIVCEAQWRSHDWGDTKIDFVLRSVEALARRLDEVGIPLLVRRAEMFDELPGTLTDLVKELGVRAVFANQEYEVNEQRRDRAVETSLAALGCSTHWFHDQVALAPERLRTGAGKPFSVFSPFKRAWIRQAEGDGLDSLTPESPGRRGAGISLQGRSEVLGAARMRLDPSPEIVALWPAGEEEAARRLEAFVGDRVSGYRDNRDLASREATSRLSPYLAVGALSVRQCLWAALEANDGRLQDGLRGVDTWISELLWREFYRHVLVGFPRVSMNRAFRPETEGVRWRDDATGFSAWCAGRTGVPFVDAGMRELAATGWMHNRLRMVTAMFLTKDLLVDWRLGERHFMRHLVDADLANNNGGWQWSASTGVDAAPYFRIFNPWTQGKRYDPQAEYIHRWVPELRDLPASEVHDPARLAARLGKLDYPKPIVNHQTARIRALNAFERIKETA
jgi:deoxyribodipyrimidine photo-lyase